MTGCVFSIGGATKISAKARAKNNTETTDKQKKGDAGPKQLAKDNEETLCRPCDFATEDTIMYIGNIFYLRGCFRVVPLRSLIFLRS